MWECEKCGSVWGVEALLKLHTLFTHLYGGGLFVYFIPYKRYSSCLHKPNLSRPKIMCTGTQIAKWWYVCEDYVVYIICRQLFYKLPDRRRHLFCRCPPLHSPGVYPL